MRLKSIFSTLENVSPKLTAKVAYHFMSNPKLKKIRPFEKSILKIAKQSTLKFNHYDIAVYKWGEGTRKVLLVHGWEGRSSNFGGIIPLLLDKGYQVISFDLPCHGNSTKKKANVFECSGLVEIFLKKNFYDLILTHSMGSVITFMAMDSLKKYKGNKLVVLTTPNRFEDFLDLALDNFGLTEKTKYALVKLLRTKSKYEPLDLCGTKLVEGVEMKKVFVVHDKADKVISIEDSRSICNSIKNSKFIEIEGTGHFKMLWSKKVINIFKEKILID